MSPFKELPIELTISILHFASYSSRLTAYNICLVASWTLPIARPALYQTVFVNSLQALYNVLDTIKSHSRDHSTRLERSSMTSSHHETRSSQELRLHVKHLWNVHAGPKELAEYLSLCPNVEHLAIRMTHPEMIFSSLRLKAKGEGEEETEQDATGITSNVKRLTIVNVVGPSDWEDMMAPEDGPARQFLSNLTHLVLHQTRESSQPPLDDLLNLTHVAIPFSLTKYQYNIQIAVVRGEAYSPFATAVGLLPVRDAEVKGRLQMLVLHVPPQEMTKRWGEKWPTSTSLKNLVLKANTTDKRLYITPLNQTPANVRGCWDREARGEKSIWDEAIDLLLHMSLQNLKV